MTVTKTHRILAALTGYGAKLCKEDGRGAGVIFHPAADSVSLQCVRIRN